MPGVNFFTLRAVERENSVSSILNRRSLLVKVYLPDTSHWTMKKYLIPASKKLYHQDKHNNTSTKSDILFLAQTYQNNSSIWPRGKAAFLASDYAMFCPQVGGYTDPEIFVLRPEFSLFVALIPIWSLQIYLPQLHTLQIASSTS